MPSDRGAGQSASLNPGLPGMTALRKPVLFLCAVLICCVVIGELLPAASPLTRSAKANSCADMPRGDRNSSRRISPG
jgi:hypothetical protein